jgi:serpin B
LFVRPDVPWRKEFIDVTRKHCGSSIFSVDFAGKPEAARRSINAWVEGQTKKRIAELLPSNCLSAESTMVLVNAVYFKGQWDKPFKKRTTEQLDFSRTPTDKVKTATMVQTERLLYGENKDVQVLGIPYKGHDLMMMLVLPRERNALAKLEKDLTGEQFQTWIDRLRFHDKVDVFLPRFKLTSEFSLSETLSAMGMGDAFGPGADFSKMSAKYPLKISVVRHKAFIELQEEGTEAAAATAVAMVPLAASPGPFMEPPPRVVFRADHPFLFSIVDQRTGSLLFVGRISDPTR